MRRIINADELGECTTSFNEERDGIGKDCIIQYGFPGSGSTLVWQILEHLFPGTRKTHDCPAFNDRRRVVATVRDFRDCLCTAMCRLDLPFTSAGMQQFIDGPYQTRHYLEELLKLNLTWRTSAAAVLLRYEDFVHNYDFLFDHLQEFFGLSIDATMRANLARECSLESNRSVARQMEQIARSRGAANWRDEAWHIGFNRYNVYGHHITANGEVGKWKRLVPVSLQPQLTELLHEPLARFGYL